MAGGLPAPSRMMGGVVCGSVHSVLVSHTPMVCHKVCSVAGRQSSCCPPFGIRGNCSSCSLHQHLQLCCWWFSISAHIMGRFCQWCPLVSLGLVCGRSLGVSRAVSSGAQLPAVGYSCPCLFIYVISPIHPQLSLPGASNLRFSGWAVGFNHPAVSFLL